MARTNPRDVAEIFDTELSDSTVKAWIDIATDIVDDIASNASLSESKLTRLEKLVAAHFAAAQDQRVEKETVGDVSVTYQGETGMHFEATQYGQMAIALDPTDTLADPNETDTVIESSHDL